MSEQFCDLVMKGGITSGVIYPKLIARLSTKYRFKNIGGTSAGAIAAGACAAAEFARRQGKAAAFDDLARLTEDLSAKVTPEGRTRLFTLFQPAADLRRHFAVMVGALNARQRDAVFALLGGLLRMYALPTLLALLAGSVLLWPFAKALAPAMPHATAAAVGACTMGLVALMAVLAMRNAARGRWQAAAFWLLLTLCLAAALLAVSTGRPLSPQLVGSALGMIVVAAMVLVQVLALIVLLFARGLLAGLHDNGYGLCTGRTPDDGTEDRPALTDWLTVYFNQLAGLPPGGDPLTFEQLWGHADPEAPRETNLEVMTSAISQQMIYSIPFRPGTPTFYYDPEEWSRLFPAQVMRHLAQAHQRHPHGDSVDPLPEGARVTGADSRPLRPLPRRADLPVVVAVRMSLSFPILLSAVPLYSVDMSRKENQARIKGMRATPSATDRAKAPPLEATRVWFSDGGIGSNMPLHMFDALLPGHPTFAVNLKPEHPDYPIQTPERSANDAGRIYLPDSNRGGHLRYWPQPNDATSLGGLVGFLLGIVDTMQNWRDEIQFPYPGFRDRIIQISQKPKEGGLNLDMPDKNIEALANAGALAADRLIDWFHPGGALHGKGWEAHLDARLRTLLGIMQPGAAALAPSLTGGTWSARVTTFKDYNMAERTLAVDFLSGLQGMSTLATGTNLSLASNAPKPLAQVRIAPRI